MYLIQHTDFITGEKYNAPSNSSYSSIEYYYFSPYISFIYIFVISSISSTKWNTFLYSLHQTHNTASCRKVTHHFWAAECVIFIHSGLQMKTWEMTQNKDTRLTSMAIPMIKIRRSCDRLVLSLSWESPYLNSLSFYWNRALPPFLYGFLTSCWGISHWEKWHFCKHISQWLRP